MTDQTNPAALAQRDDPGPAALAPVAGIGTLVASFEAYEEAKRRLLTDEDYQVTWETDANGRKKQFTKRSGWRKLAIAFGVDFRITEEIITYENPELREGIVSAEYKVLATAPNGRCVDATGFCSRSERCCAPGCEKGGRHQHCPAAFNQPCHPKRHYSKPDHDIPTTAETRAKNRAAADLFGMGEITAEEAEAGGGMDPHEEPQPDAYIQELARAVTALVKDAAGKDLIDKRNLDIRSKALTLIASGSTALGYTGSLDKQSGNDIWMWCRIELGLATDEERAAFAEAHPPAEAEPEDLEPIEEEPEG